MSQTPDQKRRWHRRRLQLGLCPRCGFDLDREGRSCCSDCAARKEQIRKVGSHGNPVISEASAPTTSEAQK